MKREGNSSNCIIEIEDDLFLSQVAALEADALSRKRRKITASTEADGLYTAALRGSDNLLQLQPTAEGTNTIKASTADSGSCFKCGRSGHWARDCVDSTGAVNNGYGNLGKDEAMAEKPCPCGLGACVVLTANTDRNRGRKFYKCPLRNDAGGCGFFQWCDSDSSAPSSVSPSFPDLPCPCGSGTCLILTAKTGKNVGQQFYRCPGNQGSSCGFFKWCNELTVEGGSSVSTYRKSNNHMGEKSKPSFDLGSGSSCFKCGKAGHWAKDCSTASASSNSPAAAGAGGRRPATAPSNTCYKCNQAGHWARDCPST